MSIMGDYVEVAPGLWLNRHLGDYTDQLEISGAPEDPHPIYDAVVALLGDPSIEPKAHRLTPAQTKRERTKITKAQNKLLEEASHEEDPQQSEAAGAVPVGH